MKIFLCFFLIHIYRCQGDSEQSGNYWRELYDDGNRGHQQQEPLVRPCSLKDLNCIRQYLANNYQCSQAFGPAPDPQRIKSIPMYIPHANLTFVLYDVEVKGFNDFKVKEFFINKKTDNLVLEVVLKKIWVYSPYIVITYHRRGKEPIELADFGFIEYNDLSLTLTVSRIKDSKETKVHVYTHLSDAAPQSGLGPAFMESKEPDVQAALKRLFGNMGVSLREAFVTQGPIFMSVVLQNSICKL